MPLESREEKKSVNVKKLASQGKLGIQFKKIHVLVSIKLGNEMIRNLHMFPLY